MTPAWKQVYGWTTALAGMAVTAFVYPVMAIVMLPLMAIVIILAPLLVEEADNDR